MQEEYALKSNETVAIIPIGDAHIGSPQFDIKFFKSMLKNINSIKRKRIYLLGDMLEVASKSVANSSYEQVCPVEEQREYFIDNFKPFKDDIVGFAIGNHEARLNKEFGYNLVKDMCRELDIPYYNQSLDTFKINDFDFSVYTRHSKGSSQRKHLAMGKMEKETQDIYADLYIQGHQHRLLFWDQLKRFPTGYKRIYYAQCGSFLGYNGYADSMHLQRELPSYQIINVNQNRDVKSTKYYAELDDL